MKSPSYNSSKNTMRSFTYLRLLLLVSFSIVINLGTVFSQTQYSVFFQLQEPGVSQPYVCGSGKSFKYRALISPQPSFNPANLEDILWNVTGGTVHMSYSDRLLANIEWDESDNHSISIILIGQEVGGTMELGPINIPVSPEPNPQIDVENKLICSGVDVSLQLTASGASYYSWENLNNTSDPINGSSTQTVGITVNLLPGETVTYRLRGKAALNAPSACEKFTDIQISAIETPSDPSFTDLYIFSGQTAEIIPDSPLDVTLNWYNSESGGNLLAISPRYNLGVQTVDQEGQEKLLQYYAEAVNMGCVSSNDRQLAKVYVIPTVDIVSSNGLSYLEPNEPYTLQTSHAYTYDSYSWQKDGQILGESNQLTVTEPGAYSLTVSRGGVNFTTSTFIVTRLNADQNYTRIDYALEPVSDEPTFVSSGIQIKQTSIQFYDGLGRPVQSIAQAYSPNGFDLVVHNEYDQLGRQSQQYLPFVSVSQNGIFNYGAKNQILDFYDPTGTQPSDITKDEVPFTETVFEHSPLARPTEQKGLGQNWVGKSAKFEQYVNQSSDLVLIWQFDITSNTISTSGAYYPDNSLWVQEVVDEQDQKVIQYLNRRGQVILKRSLLDEPGTPYVSTYYVYDEIGRMRYVVPPLAVKKLLDDPGLSPNDQEIQRLLYYYEYDQRGRLIKKRVPDTEGEVFLVYDDLNRLVLSQDAVQRQSNNQWNFIKYDNLSRPVMSGLYYPGTNTNTQEAMQDAVPKGTPEYTLQSGDVNEDPFDHRILTDELGYVNDTDTLKYKAHQSLDLGNGQDYVAVEGSTYYVFEIDANHTPASPPPSTTPELEASKFPILSNTECQVLSITYYDTYSFVEENRLNYDPGQFSSLANATAPTSRDLVKGLTTGSMIKVLDESDQGDGPEWLTTVSYYDERYRSIQVKGENHKGGIDIVSVQYENIVSGEVAETHTWHENPEDVVFSEISIVESFSYDRLGRLEQTNHSINGAPATTLAKYHYNELGQVIRKELAPNATDETRQILDFSYNIRGWLKKMNEESLLDPITNHDDLFSMELFYEEGFRENQNGEAGKKQYNGNISGMRWTSLSEQAGTGTTTRSHSYAYAYDKLNRLSSAIYGTRELDPLNNPNNFGWENSTQNFSVDFIQYDVNGNITRLKRMGMIGRDDYDPTMSGPAPAQFGLMDDLSYEYDGNQLIGVDDLAESTSKQTGMAGDFTDWRGSSPTIWSSGANEYTYDINGSLMTDANKGITSIQYNHLSLATQINYGSSNSIQYHYDAAGVKLQKEVYEDNQLSLVTDYVGIFIYENDELAFIQMAEGRVLPPMRTGRADFDYEYHIQDHLGNLRVAYRKGDEIVSYGATMEPEKAIEERREFLNIDKTRDETWSASGVYSAKLNASQPLGPWKEIQIGKGDQIDISVQAHYEPLENEEPDKSLQLFLELNPDYSDYHNEFGENQPQAASINRLQAGIALNPSLSNPSDNEAPNAYLKYLVYDMNHNLITEGVVYVNSSEAKGDGINYTQDIGQKLELNYVADQDCYIDIFVANESGDAEVWFDDLTVDLDPSLIVQENAYYPFGLEIATLSKSNRLPNHFTFNGQSEKQKDLGGGNGYFYETDWRGYDPQLGRFHSVDPLTDFFPGITPYHFAYNNPIGFNDPTGLMAEDGNEKKDPERKRKRKGKRKRKRQEKKLKKGKSRVSLPGVSGKRRKKSKDKNDKDDDDDDDDDDTVGGITSLSSVTVTAKRRKPFGQTKVGKAITGAGKFLFNLTPASDALELVTGADIDGERINRAETVGWFIAGLFGGKIIKAGFKLIKKYKLHRRLRAKGAANKGDNVPKYDPRIRKRAVEDPGGHNFPFSFDEAILKTKPTTIRGGAQGYALRGIKNRKDVIYNIVVEDGVITHRDMIKVKNWSQRSKSFGWPTKLEDIPTISQ